MLVSARPAWTSSQEPLQLSKHDENASSIWSGSKPWEILSVLIQDWEHDHKVWWQLSAPVLGILMEEAQYDIKSQYACLIFHLRYITPRLGPSPARKATACAWKSFMNDDFSPLEYSWNWDSPTSKPKIRYSIEAIGRTAGSVVDEFNQGSTMELRDQLANVLPDLNWSWFRSLSGVFCDTSLRSKQPHTVDSNQSSPSSVFLAFELGTSIASKAYFVPVRAEQLGISRMSILTEAIDAIRTDKIHHPAYNKFLNYTETFEGRKLEIIGAAIDCVKPEQSRFKIYVRSPTTSFQSVCDTMSLGGETKALSEVSRKELKDLWYLTLGLDKDFPEDKELPRQEHETGGILYNIDVKPNTPEPDLKLYVPLKHYAKNDVAAAEGLGKFLQARKQDAYFQNYMRVLERTCTHRRLADAKGFQTYIGVGVRKDDTLALCSYINSEVYHPGRKF